MMQIDRSLDGHVLAQKADDCSWDSLKVCLVGLIDLNKIIKVHLFTMSEEQEKEANHVTKAIPILSRFEQHLYHFLLH